MMPFEKTLHGLLGQLQLLQHFHAAAELLQGTAETQPCQTAGHHQSLQ